jgi:hypothetical protein
MRLGVASAVVLLLAMGAGCGGGTNPRFEEVSHQFYKAYCKRLHECMKEIQGDALGETSFTKAYPGGESDCIDDNYKEFSSLNELESKCGQDVWDKCVKDLEDKALSPCTQSTTTPAIGVKLPDSCRGC